MSTAVKMGPNAGPNYSLDVPDSSRIVIEFAYDGADGLLFRTGKVSKIHIITPFAYEASVHIRGETIPYRCVIEPKVKAGMELNKHPNTLNADLRDHVMKEFQGQAQKLLIESEGAPPMALEVAHNDRRYYCEFEIIPISSKTD